MESILTHPTLADAPMKLTPVRHLMRAVWIQALRRNEIFVLGILLGLYLLGAVILRIVGIQSAQTARFITGLGLELGALLSSLLVIVMGTRHLPQEMELRTLYPVLAKPVTRAQVLLGKALPTWATGMAAMALFTAVTLAITPRMPYQHAAGLAQALVLKAAGLAMLTALGLWLSLIMPAAVAMLVSAALAWGGAMAGNVAVQAASGASWASWTVAALIPDWRLLHQFGRYVDGGANLTWTVFGGLLLYGALWTAIFFTLASRRFNRLAL